MVAEDGPTVDGEQRGVHGQRGTVHGLLSFFSAWAAGVRAARRGRQGHRRRGGVEGEVRQPDGVVSLRRAPVSFVDFWR